MNNEQKKRMCVILEVGAVFVLCTLIITTMSRILYVPATTLPPPTTAELRAGLVRLVEVGKQPEWKLEAFDKANSE